MISKNECILHLSYFEEEPPAQLSTFLNDYGYQNGDHNMKHINYHPARLSKGKKWYVSFQYRNPKTGKFEKFRVTKGINRIHDEKEKEEFARDLIDGVNRFLKRGGNPFKKSIETIAAQPKQWTLGQGLNYFKQKLPDRKLRARTVKAYSLTVKMLAKALTPYLNNDITTITRRHIEAALSNNEWANTTYNNNLTNIKLIFNWLIEREVLEKNPAKKIKALSRLVTTHKSFTAEMWGEAIKKAPPDLADFIMFLYHSGMRPAEATRLTSEHLDFHKRLIEISGDIAKNKKSRFNPMSDYIFEKYRNHKGILFIRHNSYYEKLFRQLRPEIGASKKHTMYSLCRHSRALHLAADGVSIYNIMQFLGHSSPEITMKYLRDIGATINREAAEKGLRF